MNLILCLILTATPVKLYAIDGIFFNYSSAKKLGIDLKFYKTNYPILIEKNSINENIIKTLKEQKDNNDILITNLQNDKKEYEKITTTYKENLTKSNKELNDCNNDKPSKLTWFSLGFVSSIILAVLLNFTIKE